MVKNIQRRSTMSNMSSNASAHLPPNFYFVLTDANTFTVLTPSGALVVDKKTFKVVKFVPEHPIVISATTVIPAVVTLLRDTEGSEGAERLHMQAAKLLVSIAETVTAQVTETAASGSVKTYA
jgi:hypothetical protein